MKTMKRFSTLFAILLILSISIHVGHVQNAVANEADWMPDANLRTAVRTSLGLADNEELTQAKMLDLTELKAAGRGISNLTGIQHATNLTVARLAGNQISNLSPLAGLTELTTLRLQKNQISNISSLSGLTKLTQLFLNENQISSVEPLTSLTNLVELKISGNSITNAHLLSSLPKLTTVDIMIPPPPDTEAPGVSISVPSGVQTGAFNATITFTESVSGFTQSDLSLSGTASVSVTAWSANSDNTVYTATITPTASGTVTIGVAANVATDAANNQNAAATSKNVTVSVDTTAPGVTVSVPSGTQNGAFSVTITFTESVSGFTQSDVSLSGSATSITGWSANSDNTIYTATITPTASGTVTIGVAANVATDAANNQNAAATSKNVTVSVDTTAPGVTVSVPSGTQNGAFSVTITFTESVSGFTQSDVSLSGSATSITGWSANSDNTIYTATITPTASGTVTVSVAANVATDAANNSNIAATSQTVTVSVDTTAPGVTVSVPSGIQNGQFSVSITFTESISSFLRLPLELGTNTAGATINSGHVVSANGGTTSVIQYVTPTRSGEVMLRVPAGIATDAEGNANTASEVQTVSVDVDAPGVSITVPSDVQNGAFNATITFTESVSGFVQSDFSLSGTASASVTGWNTTNNTTYTATITPTTSGTVTLGVAAGVVTDAANNQNTAATSKTVTVGVDKPSVTIGVPLGTQTGAFDATITFTETVSGFVGSDVSLTGSAASITSWSANSDDTVYTATITPTASGTITLGVAANVATDAANNQNTAATSKNVTVSVDTTAPGVSISVPSGTQNGAFNATITFTETVSGFVGSDVSLSGSAASITSWSANSDDTVYTATITPTASGTVTIGVAANVATDATGNNNTAATSKNVTVSVDTNAPGVSIAVPSGLQNGAFNATITFTETVSGFVGSDVSLSGSAASITSWSANSDNTVYTATITPTASGTVTIGVAANVATDGANNQNTAATSKNVTVSVDTTAPGVTVSVPSGTQMGAFDVTITFTETVSGFVGSDVSLSGSAASITGWSVNNDNTVYTATIIPTASGTITLGVAANVATDAANNPNTAATSKNVTVSVDTTAPGVTVSVPSGTQMGAFDVTITFTETVSGFVGSDVSLSGSAASITGWSANNDNTVYTATITPTASGTITLGVAANVATDAANNPNTAATSQTVTVNIDVEPPGVSITVPSEAQRGAFAALITFTEAVSGFEQTDLSLAPNTAGATITTWVADGNQTRYVAVITTTTSGEVTFNIAAGVATDAANNPNTAATSKTVSVDVDAPGVSLAVPSGVQTGAFNVTITFTEAVSGFVKGDVSFLEAIVGSGKDSVSVIGSTANASITAWSTTDNITYTATITPTSSGDVTLGVAANVATDAANNPNTVATSKTVTVDVDRPTVTIGVPSGTQTGAFDTTITFTETVSDFVGSDVSLTGSVASITAWNANSNSTIYTATITPTASGTVTVGVAADVVTDAAGNNNTAATSKNVTVSVDTTAPGVTVSVPSGTQMGAFDVTITFTETVSGFVGSDVSLSGSAASITGWSANSDNTVYTATITPTASGTVTVSVAANVAIDAANNPNTAATSQTVTVDIDKPWVTISVPSETQNNAFNTTITFSEAVSNFVASDVSLSGSAASITSWSVNNRNTVYTATITPTASGTVTVGVAANVTNDAANNSNTAAISQTVSVDIDKPSVTIGVPSGTQTGAFDVTITFTESVSDFKQSDVNLTGDASATITAWSANTENIVYTATIIPTTSGTVTLSVAADVATDTASNPNTAATPQTVTIAMPELVQDLTTWMPDANLRNAVRKALKLASDETFSQEDMQSLTRLSVRNRIQDLTGLEHATQLTELDVRYSDISDISPLAGLTSLTILDLRGNNISDVTPLAKLVNLEKLWLSENPITDISPLAGLTALRWLVIMSANLSNVTPLAKLVNLEQLLLAGNSITDFSPLLNLNNLQYADVEIPEPEPELLEVSISVPSDVQNGAFDATITFSEAVSDFVQADVSLGGSAASITSWSANSDNTVYTAAITPTASGAVTIGVAASVATDAANNSNTAATSQTVTVDVDKPTVIIGTPSGTQTGAFNATITFSETVSGFVGSEVSLSGSAASITSWSANNDNTVYTATITPTASGTITLGVAANVATDAANNPNTAATSQTVTIDVDKPTVTIGVPSGTQSSAFDTTITFSETVSGFTQSEVSLSGSAASITSWSANSDNIVYTVTITPTASGTVTIGVAANVATDAANNTNTAATSQTVTVDVDRPTVTIGVPSDTQTDAFDVTITFSESVSGFVQSDLSLTGDASASVTAWSANTENTAYTATITPTTSGAVTLNVSAGVAKDAGNNANTAATSQTVRVDVDAPSVSIAMPSGDQTGAFDVTITFSESVSGFAQTDVFVAGTASASITAWNTADDTTFTATLTPSISGTVSLSVPANVATDAANNPNTASDTQTVTTFVTQPQQVDTTSPGVNITVPSVTQRSAFDVTITFTEVVSGFVQSELSLGGTANASVTVWSANSENTVYTATITPTSSGTVILSITANVATDAAKNPNTAGTSQTVNIDIDAPSVSITVPSDVQGSAFDATITFTEVVSGFEQTDVSLTGTATASITAWVASSDNTTYTATITPTRSGTVTLNVASDVATDAANNPNTAATSQTVNIDVDAPGVSITVPSDPQNTAFNVTITFSESVSDFVQSDVTFTGDSSASITAWSANTENTTYTATITPTTSGEVTLGVSANVATDAANNPNTAATSQAVTVDVDRPTTTIGVPSGTQAGAFDATITFSETVSGFTETEISLTGSAASITSWSANSANTVYTATITPTASGTVTVSVAANVASDTAGNNNTAATSQSVTVNVPDPIPDPATWMPDANLRTAVRKALKLASDAMFTQDEMRSLTNLSAASSRISDITGLEHATQLTTLNVGGNNISDISPLAGLTALRSLDLQSANVSDVTPLANLVNLGRLYITGNPVTDFSPLSSLNSLKADVEIPGVGVSITVSQGVQNGYYWWNRSYYQNGPFEVTITFTEEVSGFEQSDLVLDYSNYTSSPLSVSITAWNTTDNITYTATMTPTTSGAVGIKVPEGVAADAADNPNTSGYTQTGIRLTVEVPDEQLAELLRLAFDAIDRSNDLLLHDYMPLLTDVSVNPLYAARRIIPSDMNISDLTGLEYATNLETLDLMGYSDVSDLTPLTGLTNLEILKLHGPDVSDFTPLSSLTNLETLNLMGYSDVSDFTPLSGLTNLETLDLESSVSDLTPLSGLTNLKTLKLYRAGNSDTVSDLTALSGLTNLETLDLRRYIVSDLTSLSGLTNLKSLKITSSSSVSSLSGLSGLTNLETLDLHWNVVSDLTPLSGLTNLKTLNLSNNSISSLTPLSSLTNLESLDLDKNSISSLRGLSGLTNLNTLSIQNNSVSDISDLSGLTNLTTLFLTGNSISDVTPLSGLTNLRRLSLARCSISDVTPLSGLTNLGRLDLSNNSISDVTPLSGLTNLGYLNLSNNSILDTSPLYTLVADHSVNVDIAVYAYWDVNTDGSVNETDENLVTAALGQTGEDIVNFRTDVNRDGTVDSADLLLVTENLDPPPDRPLPPFPFAPSALDMQALEMLDPAVIEAQLAILRAESDGSLKYLRAIALLESALAALRPDETRLLANYPNPFNPETWIPYHLANDSELSITIYDVGGTVVRRLELGHQRAGYYTSRSRAAYWDGRNEFGERVATGIYFYQLQADNMSLLRKMVILK